MMENIYFSVLSARVCMVNDHSNACPQCTYVMTYIEKISTDLEHRMNPDFKNRMIPDIANQYVQVYVVYNL